MALVNVVNMVVLDNPCSFLNPFQFEITFECLQELEDDLEWKVLYVGSAHDSTKDQVLDEVLVGPVPVGVNKFVLQADPPDPAQLPPEEILGVTVVLVTCSFQEREFVRVGYYVNNEYHNPADEQQQQQQEADPNAEPVPPPQYPDLDMNLVQRQILADKPRVTKFPIPWTKQQQEQMAAAVEQQQGEHSNLSMATMDDAAVSPEHQLDRKASLMDTPSTAGTDEMDVDG